jgi:mannose-6-phosphate isomerase-like protein (cupin superfamily)
MSKLEVFYPTCNLSTVRDGRGGILTWVPPEPILEFNLIYYNPGTFRGLHYHPEFVEYLLIVDGSGVLVSPEDSPKAQDERVLHLSKGICVRMPPGVIHTVYPIAPMTGVAMLTRKWDDCEVPAVRVEELLEGPYADSGPRRARSRRIRTMHRVEPLRRPHRRVRRMR